MSQSSATITGCSQFHLNPFSPKSFHIIAKLTERTIAYIIDSFVIFFNTFFDILSSLRIVFASNTNGLSLYKNLRAC